MLVVYWLMFVGWLLCVVCACLFVVRCLSLFVVRCALFLVCLFLFAVLGVWHCSLFVVC